MRVLLALLLLPLVVAQAAEEGPATYYHPSLHGNSMGCRPYLPYNRWDPTIVAVNPSRMDWPCGTVLEIAGPAGTILVTRQDSCPECARNHVDLSEAANLIVCGAPAHTCRVQIRAISSSLED